MSDLINSIMHVNPSGQSFVEAVFAGLVDMFFEVILVVLALGALLKHQEQKKWTRTRQGLSYVLVGSMEQVTKYSRALIFNKDERIVLNGDLRIHISKLRLSLSNFNEQVIVHLLSLLPTLSERLSDLTYTAGRLEESALELDFYFNNLENRCPQFDAKNPDIGKVDPSNFKPDKLGNLDLRDSSVLSNENYFVAALVQISQRLKEVQQSVDFILHDHAKEWHGFNRESAESINNRRKIIKDTLVTLEEDINKIKENGIYLVMYRPNMT